MTIFYVSSVDGSNSDDGLSWTNAVATLEYAVETLAASGGPHTILVSHLHRDALGADTTFTAAQDLRILSVNRTGSDAPLAGAVIGSQTAGHTLIFGGARKVYMYGLTVKSGTDTAYANIRINVDDGGHFELEECDLWLAVNGGSGEIIQINSNSWQGNSYTRLVNTRLRFSHAAQMVALYCGTLEWEGGGVDSAGVVPTTLFAPSQLLTVKAEGVNFRHLTSATLVGSSGSDGTSEFVFTNCSWASTTTIKATQTTVLNKGATTVRAFNCAAGDVHINLFHGDAFGETVASTAYYADDTEPGGNNVSWKITTYANNCSFFTPYVSPWFDAYNSDTSTAITPFIEGLRVDSTTVIQDDEVWAEFSYQGTSGFPQAVFVKDRMALLGTPANQTSTKGFADWTGTPTDTDSGDSTFKLVAPASFTPAEIGDLSARIIVGEPGLTIYIDPVIRT